MPTRQEINRKLLHLIALLMPAGVFYIPELTSFSKWTAPAVLASLFFLCLAVERMRFVFPGIRKIFDVCFSPLMRADEQQQTTGATYIILGALICSVAFVDSPQVSFIVLFLFILGDAAAALVGLSMGRIRFFGKSLEGSLACFGLCMTQFALFFPHVPHLMDHWEGGAIPFAVMLTTSLAVTLLELFAIEIAAFKLNDNLYVPAAAGWVMLAAQRMI